MQVLLRVRVRHSNSHTGVPGEWSFNGRSASAVCYAASTSSQSERWSHTTTVLGSVELACRSTLGLATPLHRIRLPLSLQRAERKADPSRVDRYGIRFDFPSHEVDHINRVDFEYQGDYSERTWAHTTFGYESKMKTAVCTADVTFGQTHGQRLNHAMHTCSSCSRSEGCLVIGGCRFVHNSAFGNRACPVCCTHSALALKGGGIFWNTSAFLLCAGIQRTAFRGDVCGPAVFVPNTGLKPERTRAFEAGIQQGLLRGKYAI